MKNNYLRNAFDTIDLYGETPNQFTIKGRTNLHSVCGVMFSIVSVTAIVAFTCLKLFFVAIKHNPNISVFKEAEMHTTEETALDLDK